MAWWEWQVQNQQVVAERQSKFTVKHHRRGLCSGLTALVSNDAWHGTAAEVHNKKGVIGPWGWHDGLLVSPCGLWV